MEHWAQGVFPLYVITKTLRYNLARWRWANMKAATLFALAVILGCGFAAAQTQYKVLWSFAGSAAMDGAGPMGSLVFDRSGNLYGTTNGGGSAPACSSSGGCGTLFELSPNADGSWTETILYNFCSNSSPNGCLDGAYPKAGLVLDSTGNLYGTTSIGGSSTECGFGGCGGGTVFELSPPLAPGGAWSQTVLYNFCTRINNSNCLDGAVPLSRLTIDGAGNIYGTTSTGGLGGTGGGGCCMGGVVFELSPVSGGWNQIVLYSFCANGHDGICADGVAPQAGVVLDKAGNLYGTTESGGSPNSPGEGTVYKLTPGSNGWAETVLLAPQFPYGKGGIPLGELSFDTLGNLYSTFSAGGQGSAGGVFRLSPKNGGTFTTFSFNSQDGKTPTSGVLVDSKHASIYGTTANGGANRFYGTAFKIESPAKETVLYNFCSQPSCTDGYTPMGGLIVDKTGNLYGTTNAGGTNSSSCFGSGCGVVFEISPSGAPGSRPPSGR
jgi:uncharacterized repeat protein (TIGR03803 family)